MIERMPADAAPARSGLTRRALLHRGSYAVAAALLAAPLAGCGIRAQSGPSDLPFVPSRDAGPGEDVLLAVWAETLALRDVALAVGGAATALPAILAGLHSDQGQILSDALDRLGVPEDVQFAARTAVLGPDGSPTGPVPIPTSAPTSDSSPTGTASPATPTTSPTATATAPAGGAEGSSGEALGAEEASSVTADRLTAVVSVPTELYPAIATLLAQRAAAATLLGISITWPDPDLTAPAAIQPLLDAVRSAAYGFEVVLAQGAKTREELATSTLDTLRGRVRALGEVMGDTAQPPVAGYALPFEVATPDAAGRLATEVLTGLRTSVAAAVPALRDQPDAQSVTIETLTEAEVLARRWALPLMAFPGLS